MMWATVWFESTVMDYIIVREYWLNVPFLDFHVLPVDDAILSCELMTQGLCCCFATVDYVACC
jgi:hypothetical protein